MNDHKSITNSSADKWIRKAVKCLKNLRYSESCGHFCIAFKLSTNCCPKYRQLTDTWKSTFLYVFDRHIHHLETNADNQTIINAFNAAIDAFPECEDLLYNKGIYFYKRGNLSEAVSCFVSSLALNPDYNLSHLCLENIKSSAIARWHYVMINDIKRNNAFKNAIQRAVQNGFNTVLDIGSGSGLLSLYSLEVGANRVYACEVSEMLFHLCKDVFETNGVIDRVVLFNQMSTDLRIPQMIQKPVSLVVTEIFDAALFGEHVLTTIHSALKNLLDPNHGLVLPISASVYGVLIESDELSDIFTLNRKQFGNVVLSDNEVICVDFNDFKYTTIDLTKVVDKKYLSQRFKIIDINFNDITQIETLLDSDYVLTLNVEGVTNGRLDAIGVWFDLNLFDDISISTEPPTELIGWEQALYPASVERISIDNKTEVSLRFTLSEDYLRLIDLKIINESNSHKNCETIKFNSELIKYLNADNFHNLYINAIENVIKSENISKLIDLNYFCVSSLHFIQSQSISQLLIVTEDEQMRDNSKKFINVCKVETNKIKFLCFDDLVASDQRIENSLVIFDLIESSGLMRSNLLEKLAYLKVYSLNSPIFMPFKVIVKGVLINSEDLIIRSRLVSDHNVHGFKIKAFINIFETEILQNIDLKKIKFSKLSQCLDLIEIDFNELMQSNQEINIEPKNECLVDITERGRLDAILYWYELHLTQEIVVKSLDLGPNWHSAAFVLKDSIRVQNDNKIQFSVMFTNGFLRFKNLRIN